MSENLDIKGYVERLEQGSGFVRVSGWLAWSDWSPVVGGVNIRIGDIPAFRIDTLNYRRDLELQGVVGGLCELSAVVRHDGLVSEATHVYASVGSGQEHLLPILGGANRVFRPEGGFFEVSRKRISGWVFDPLNWINGSSPSIVVDNEFHIPFQSSMETASVSIAVIGDFGKPCEQYNKLQFSLEPNLTKQKTKKDYSKSARNDDEPYSVSLVSSDHEVSRESSLVDSAAETFAEQLSATPNGVAISLQPMKTDSDPRQLAVESAPTATAEMAIPTSHLLTGTATSYDLEKLKLVITKERLFDSTWYARRYKITATAEDDLLDDFLLKGVNEGRNPNALFDSDFYKNSYMTTNQGDTSPFFHYLTIGDKNQHWPHPLIDAPFVSGQLEKRNIVGGILGTLLHKCVALLLDPHPIFSVRYYINKYPEIRRHRVHPVIHFIEKGDAEQRSPHPLFWPDYFIAQAGLADHHGNYLSDYLRNERYFKVDPNPFFDVEDYQNRYPDLKGQNRNFLYHYLRFGQYEERSPNKAIDLDWMSREYAQQLRITNLDPLSFLLTQNSSYLRPNTRNQALARTAKVTPQLNNDQSPLVDRIASLKKRRFKLLLVSHNLKVQGAQTSLFELAVGMKRKFGHEVHILAPDKGPMQERYRAEGVPVHTYALPVAGLADELAYTQLLVRFESQIADLNPDIVHGNTIQSYHALAIASRCHMPTVWNIRESEDPGSHGANFHPNAGRLLGEAIAGSHQFAFVSEVTKELWRKAHPQISATTINNGIDYNRLNLDFRNGHRKACRAAYQIKDDDIVLLSVGTWTERKGQRDAVQALAKIDRRLWPTVRLVLVGANESPYGKQVLDDIQGLPKALRNRISVYGETAGLAERVRVLQAYAAADIFVFTSLIESYPRVINEAMFYALPIVATPCFGVIEQLEENISCKFYDFGNTSQLAAILQQMIVDRDLRRTLGLAARYGAFHKVMQYEEMLDGYNSIYNNLVTSAISMEKT